MLRWRDQHERVDWFKDLHICGDMLSCYAAIYFDWPPCAKLCALFVRYRFILSIVTSVIKCAFTVDVIWSNQRAAQWLRHSSIQISRKVSRARDLSEIYSTIWRLARRGWRISPLRIRQPMRFRCYLASRFAYLLVASAKRNVAPIAMSLWKSSNRDLETVPTDISKKPCRGTPAPVLPAEMLGFKIEQNSLCPLTIPVEHDSWISKWNNWKEEITGNISCGNTRMTKQWPAGKSSKWLR